MKISRKIILPITGIILMAVLVIAANSIYLDEGSILGLSSDSSLVFGGTEINVTSDKFNHVYYINPNNNEDFISTINNAEANSLIVIPPESSYTINASEIVFKNGQTLIGAGMKSSLIYSNSTLLVSSVDYVTFANFGFIQSAESDGIKIYDSYKTVVDSVFVNSTYSGSITAEYGGLMLHDCIDCIVTKNEISGALWDVGLWVVRETRNDSVTSSNNLISSNYIHNIGTALSNATGSGIENEAGTNSFGVGNIYSNNVIQDTESHGLRLIQCHNCLAEGNLIRDTGNTGIWVKEGMNNNVVANTIYNTTGAGILLLEQNNSLVSGNHILNGGSGSFQDYGIWISTTASDNIVINNALINDSIIINNTDNYVSQVSGNNVFIYSDMYFESGFELGIGTDDAKAKIDVREPTTTLIAAEFTRDGTDTERCQFIRSRTSGGGSNGCERDLSSANTAGPLWYLIDDHAANDQELFYTKIDGTGPTWQIFQSQDVEVIDFDGCTDGGTTHTTVAGSIKVQMPNGATGYLNVYT